MKILSAIVIQNKYSTDTVYLHTDLPSTCPNISQEPLFLKFDVEADKGPEYVRTHFGLEPEVIRSR